MKQFSFSFFSLALIFFISFASITAVQTQDPSSIMDLESTTQGTLFHACNVKWNGG